MQSNWYIKSQEQGNSYGPYSTEEIQHFLQLGKIREDFWLSQDQQNWSTIENALKGKKESRQVTRVMPDRPVAANTLFGNYEILETIGRGGMGIVYKARDIKLNRLVALKCIRDESANEEWKKRFLREAQLNASLDHPNIVRVLESSDQPKPYIAMEYLQGRPLSTLIKEGLLSMQQTVEIFRQICEAIEYAHRQKIIHRDIKPANIMILNNGTVKVMDFGLAKNLDVSQSFSHVGQIMGTPKYMSPEQARGKKVDKRTDIYALGAVFYEMITNRAPYDGNTVYQILLQIAEKDPIPPRELNPQIPNDLQTICLKCLEKKVERRYYSTRNLCKDLELFLANKPIQAKDPNFIEKTTKWVQRNKVASILMLAITLCFFLAVWAWGESSKKNFLLEENQKYLLENQKHLLTKHYKEGCSWFHQKQFQDAIKCFSDAIKQKKQDLSSHWMMACSYLASSQIDLAQKKLKEAIAMEERAEFFLLQSLCYAEQKKIREAQEAWQKASDKIFSRKVSWEDCLSKLSAMNLDERMDFIMPLPEEELMDKKARYYSLLLLLPEEEYNTAQSLLRKEDARAKYKSNFETMLHQEVYKIGYLLNKIDTGWPKDFFAVVSALELKEMLYYVQGKCILNMASPYWTRLMPKTQGQYAKLYQEKYAQEIHTSIEKTFREKSSKTGKEVEFIMMLVPPGQFLIGKPFEEEVDGPQQQVIMTQSYWISKYETTQKQWLAIVGTKPWRNNAQELEPYVIEHPDAPVSYISYADIQADFLSNIKQSEYLLPNEIEWEYACRAGTTSLGYWGKETPSQYIWYKENVFDLDNPTLKKAKEKIIENYPMNDWQIYNMLGNASELCQNSIFSYSLISKSINSNTFFENLSLKDSKKFAVYRGGNISDPKNQCYSSRRNSVKIGEVFPILSFRLIKKNTL
ncbi:MAG: protein kinase [Candidatus Brocadiae bacterium]|nr:protein kinase [Candidatus Brocadiia bacterium]